MDHVAEAFLFLFFFLLLTGGPHDTLQYIQNSSSFHSVIDSLYLTVIKY